ncbi:MAG TPA: hypothetical protein VFZ03_13370, partial [Dongiaceae bacterium]
MPSQLAAPSTLALLESAVNRQDSRLRFHASRVLQGPDSRPSLQFLSIGALAPGDHAANAGLDRIESPGNAILNRKHKGNSLCLCF